MPKSKLGINKDNELHKQIRAMIIYKQELNGISTTELAVSAQLSVSTLYERLRSPSHFRLSELRKVCKKLNIDIAELIEGKEDPQ